MSAFAPPLLPIAPLQATLADFRPEHLRLATGSREEAILQIGGRLSPYRLRLLGAQERFAARYLETRELAGLGLSTLAFGTEVELDISTAADHLLVTTQVSGHSLVRSQGQHAEGGPGFIVVDSTADPVAKRFSADSCRVNLRVPRWRLDATWRSLTGTEPARPLVFQPFLPEGEARQQWIAHVRLLLAYGLQSSPAPQRQAEVITESALIALLMAFPHDHRHVLDAPVAPCARAGLRAVIDYLHAYRHEPLQLADLAREGGMSVRSLTDAFRREHGVSPMKYLQAIRLDAARTLLGSRRADVSVARAATDNGFTALGRFAAAYRARFGELPSETLARR